MFAVSPLFSQQLESYGQTSQPQHSELKHLQFIEDATGFALEKSYNLAVSTYMAGRAYTPQRLDSRMRAVEVKLASLAEPVFEAVQHGGHTILTRLDGTVDLAVSTANRLFGADQEGQLVASRQHAYLLDIQQSLAFLKENGLTGTAKVAAEALAQRIEEVQRLPVTIGEEAEVLVTKVGEAWQKLVASPAVTKVIQVTEPSVEFTRAKYQSVHDAVVASATYSKAVGVADGIVKRVQGNLVYRAAAHTLYPVISPYADPALDKITHSPYYTAVLQHLKPTRATTRCTQC
jgi:hypothetical protein